MSDLMVSVSASAIATARAFPSSAPALFRAERTRELAWRACSGGEHADHEGEHAGEGGLADPFEQADVGLDLGEVFLVGRDLLGGLTGLIVGDAPGAQRVVELAQHQRLKGSPHAVSVIYRRLGV